MKKPYQFLIQVKSTNGINPYTIRNHRLKTPIKKANLSELIDRPLPSYIAGVDLNTGDVFIVSAFDRNAKFSNSIHTTFRLIRGNRTRNTLQLQQLKTDVNNYWQNLHIDAYKSSFNSLL